MAGVCRCLRCRLMQKKQNIWHHSNTTIAELKQNNKRENKWNDSHQSGISKDVRIRGHNKHSFWRSVVNLAQRSKSRGLDKQPSPWFGMLGVITAERTSTGNLRCWQCKLKPVPVSHPGIRQQIIHFVKEPACFLVYTGVHFVNVVFFACTTKSPH